MINTRSKEIRELKEKIASVNDQIRDHLTSIDVEAEARLTEEEQKANKERRMKDFALMRADVQALQEELKMKRMNKYGSTFFEFHPHKGMNRRQAKQYRKQNKR